MFVSGLQWIPITSRSDGVKSLLVSRDDGFYALEGFPDLRILLYRPPQIRPHPAEPAKGVKPLMLKVGLVWREPVSKARHWIEYHAT